MRKRKGGCKWEYPENSNQEEEENVSPAKHTGERNSEIRL
jgi:hypothetical protein